ncbi:MAG: hypothetical protein AB7O38_22200 [Pirellulaceae bacterium]
MLQVRMACRLVLGLLGLGLLPAVVAAAPAPQQLSIRGLQLGATTTLVVTGTDLTPRPRLLASFPIAEQRVAAIEADGAVHRVTLEVTLDERPLPGIYALRWASEKGVSEPLILAVDRLPQQPFRDEVAALPVALHGTLTGTQVMKTRVKGRRGETFLADAEVQQLGARFKPILRVKDARGRQLAWSSSTDRGTGDARLMLHWPADGQYTVELHDVLYRAVEPGYFRLKLGAFTAGRLVFPLGAQSGTHVPLELVGFPPRIGKLTEWEAPPVRQATFVPAPAGVEELYAGALPPMVVTLHPELVEISQPGQVQALPAVPVAISGRIERQGEEDRFVLPVTPGARIRGELWAHRWGSPLDSVLTVRDSSGQQLATSDDRAGARDAGLEFQVPAGISELQIAVRDLLGRGGEDFIYRLEITDAAAADLTIETDVDRVTIPAGTTQVVRVQIRRQGYDGLLRLVPTGLPPDIEVHGDEIPAGATIGWLSLTADGPQTAAGLLRVEAQSGDSALYRSLLVPETPVSQRFPWLRSELAWAVSEPIGVSVDWADATADVALPRGGQLPLAVSIRRKPEVAGNLRFRLLTTQVTPRKKVKENNQEKEVDDIEATLRLAEPVSVGAEATTATVPLVVPAILPNQPWGLVLSADLLAADGQTVVATVSTPTRYLRVAAP